MGTRAGDVEAAVFVAVQQNVGQVILQDELQKLVTGGGVRPAVFVGVGDNQATGFGGVPETAVVVCAATGAVLYAVDEVVVVNHLVEQGGGNLFDGAGQGSGSDVDLMGSAQLGHPGIFPEGEVTVGLGGGLDGDGGS